MARLDSRRRLIVNADDFGLSSSINLAVIEAHRQGILTSASLMVNGRACDEAVRLARENPKLAVGLHLTLVCGSATLPSAQIPGLVDRHGQFTDNPVGAGMNYFFRAGLRRQLEWEIAAQMKKFHATGLRLDHVNGHLNLHLHPAVFRILLKHAEAWQIRAVRLTRDPFRLNVRLAGGRWVYRLSHAVIFRCLAAWAEKELDRRRIARTQQVFGLLQYGRMDEAYLSSLLAHLPEGDSELYSHPSLDEFKHEFEALISPRIQASLEENKIERIRYQDLTYA
jgi:chitin disaccharide deacetylase